MTKEDFIERWAMIAMMDINDAIAHFDFIECPQSRSGWKVIPK